MAQHARPVGPTTNAAATFEPSMVQGSCPDRSPDLASWRRITRRAGWQTAQTTHVAAPFAPDMVSDARPQRNREVLPVRVGWQQWVSDIILFSPDMTQGSHPDLPRIVLGPRIPLPVSQPTHIQAAFGVDMVAGSRPDRFREFLPVRTGWAVSQTTPTAAQFTVDMIQGYEPNPRSIEQGHRGAVASPPDVPVFSIEMVQGSHPDSPRIVLGPRIPLPWSQTSHVQATFSADMVQGHMPPFSRAWIAPRAICQVLPPDVFAFSIEMVQGSKPDTPRIFLAPRLPLPWSQTTQVNAPFGIEMVSGEKPVQRPKQDLRLQIGGVAQTPDVFAFSVEMAQGSHPDAARMFLAPRLPLPLTPDVVSAMVEHVQGSRPERPRLFHMPRIPQPWSQTTPTAAAISPEMMQGVTWIPSQYRALVNGLRIVAPDIAPVVVEQVQGWHPDSPRIRLAPRLPLPVSQPTHTSAPFTPEMVIGSKPERHRQLFGKNGWIVYQVVQAVGPAASVDFILLVSADTGTILVAADPSVLVIGADPLSARVTSTDFIIVVLPDVTGFKP